MFIALILHTTTSSGVVQKHKTEKFLAMLSVETLLASSYLLLGWLAFNGN